MVVAVLLLLLWRKKRKSKEENVYKKEHLYAQNTLTSKAKNLITSSDQ